MFPRKWIAFGAGLCHCESSPIEMSIVLGLPGVSTNHKGFASRKSLPARLRHDSALGTQTPQTYGRDGMRPNKRISSRILLVLVALGLLGACRMEAVGTWTQLIRSAPGSVDTMLL